MLLNALMTGRPICPDTHQLSVSPASMLSIFSMQGREVIARIDNDRLGRDALEQRLGKLHDVRLGNGHDDQVHAVHGLGERDGRPAGLPLLRGRV